jgi:hypothetical protein
MHEVLAAQRIKSKNVSAKMKRPDNTAVEMM